MPPSLFHRTFTFVVLLLPLAGCVTPGERLSQERSEAGRAATVFCDQLLDDPAIQSLYEKTPKSISGIMSIQMLANQSKLSDAEKPLFTIWAEKSNKCRERILSGMRKYANPLLVTDRQSYYVALNTLAADLFAGQITWAQFNRTRQNLYVENRKSFAEISSALARQDDQAAIARQQAAATDYANFLQAQRNVILQQQQTPAVPTGVNCTSQAIGSGIVTTNCR